ncbi:hypothetical protein [Paremcibacter congregatus]|uniref:hypothetical protein n=1 Tax=Paremcibacter congregatus TaxID=2043170 RepID=UPI0030EC2179
MPASPARISQITQPVRTAIASDGGVKTLSLGARDVEVVSALYNDADATAENARQFTLMKQSRDLFQVPVLSMNGQFQVGQTITIKYDRFGLQAGKDYLITGVSEDFGRGQTTLTVWG